MDTPSPIYTCIFDYLILTSISGSNYWRCPYFDAHAHTTPHTHTHTHTHSTIYNVYLNHNNKPSQLLHCSRCGHDLITPQALSQPAELEGGSIPGNHLQLVPPLCKEALDLVPLLLDQSNSALNSGCLRAWMDGWMDGWMMDGWMDGWMDG